MLQSRRTQFLDGLRHINNAVLHFLPGYLHGTAVPGGNSGSGLGPCGCQSVNRSILLFLYECRRCLNVFTQAALITDWSKSFQLLTTLSEKKYSRTSLLVQCLFSFNEWPLVLSCFVSWKCDSNGGRDSPLYILKRKIRSPRFRLSVVL